MGILNYNKVFDKDHLSGRVNQENTVISGLLRPKTRPLEALIDQTCQNSK